MNPFSEKFLSNYFFRATVNDRFQKTTQQSFSIKDQEVSKDQKEILAWALQNSCTKIGVLF